MLTRADAKLIHALKSRRGREKHGLFLAEGVRVVEELLASGIDLEFAVAATTLGDTERGAALRDRLNQVTSVYELDEHKLNEVADTDTPQGVLAVARIRTAACAEVQLDPASVILVVDAIQDPGNLGTLIRTADAFGGVAVIALPGTVDFWSSKVIRSAAGSAFRMPLVQATDANAVWSWLEQNDVAVCGADMKGKPVDQLPLAGRVALVVGNEGAGLHASTRARLTHLVSIPMKGKAESLNAAMAAGILLYEFSRR